MSNTAFRPVPIPAGVTVTVTGATLTVTGPLGTLTRQLRAGLTCAVTGTELQVTGSPADKRFLGLTRSLITNMIVGVTKGYEKRLEVHGVGYRVNPSATGIQFAIGFTHPIDFALPAGIKVEPLKTGTPEITDLIVKGIDKELVGEISAKIRALRPPDVYKGKGIRYRGEYVRKKVGKRGVVAQT